MANAAKIDIQGVQWELKDQNARNRIAVLEEAISVKDLQDIKINMKSGYTATTKDIYAHYSVGKIHFMTLRIDNLAGSNIGTSVTANIGSINLYPKKETSFLLNDYMNRAILRCYLFTDGTIAVGESVGVVSGSNSCYGELIFAEE